LIKTAAAGESRRPFRREKRDGCKVQSELETLSRRRAWIFRAHGSDLWRARCCPDRWWLTLPDGNALVDAIKANRQKLTTIYISQSDPDYYFQPLRPSRRSFLRQE
jgi:hypothetical protein